ncbi:MAG: hypothetical protein ACLQNE_17210 [Thermoguttaceae bacterium]
MPKVKSIERKIANTEGFEVAILLADGRDVRSDKDGLPTYPYQNAAPNNFTIAQWRDQRFKQAYPGYDVRVWLADATEAHGATKLGTVRDSYLEE